MFCHFCQKSKKTNPFALAEGFTNFRTSTLHRHKDCKEHEDAVNEEATCMRDMFSNTQHHPSKNKNVPQNFSQGDKLSPSDQIPAQTLV